MKRHCGVVYAVGVVVVSAISFAAMGYAIAAHIYDRVTRRA